MILKGIDKYPLKNMKHEMVHGRKTLKEGRLYKWSGSMNTYKRVDGVVDYTDYIHWNNNPCKIIMIGKDIITIHDLKTDKELTTNSMWLNSNKIVFKRLSIWTLLVRWIFY